ncbi:hypothetical protein GXM_07076 [Nostoc sphaeroides CCNUC1]|uniref:Uncharacterized protein n=1 Tax=Nostoc sphaeroides CCNUC1 TaxID=2653204 RepID=A0A5P8WAG5_9NOSO|nr:hypothetical protein GXM_07076 [Nostoc sphaeroides CCNUC1]
MRYSFENYNNFAKYILEFQQFQEGINSCLMTNTKVTVSSISNANLPSFKIYERNLMFW